MSSTPIFCLYPGREVLQRGAEICYYTGKVEGDPASTVAMSTCGTHLFPSAISGPHSPRIGGGVEGMIWAHGDKFEVSPMWQHTEEISSHSHKPHSRAPPRSADLALKFQLGHKHAELGDHVVFRASDRRSGTGTMWHCGSREVDLHQSEVSQSQLPHIALPALQAVGDETDSGILRICGSVFLAQASDGRWHVELVVALDRTFYMGRGGNSVSGAVNRGTQVRASWARILRAFLTH